MLADSGPTSPGPHTPQDGILHGLRVLDLSEGMAGPQATMLLAEAGADVVKIESPRGDVTRSSAGFAVWNRSKRAMVLDLEEAGGPARLLALLPAVDVLVHGLLPDTERRLGLTPDVLCAVAPHLVVGRIRGFPAGHPDEALPGWDPLVLARLGILDEQMGHRPGPVYIRFPLASVCASYLLASGILARLYHRQRTGRGGVVTTSLAQGALVPMTMHWMQAENPSPGLAAAMPKVRGVTLFECGDGRWIHIMSAPDEVPTMKAALEAMGPDGIAEANAGALAHPYTPNHGANAVVFRTRSAQEWLDELWANDIPGEMVRRPGEVFSDEQAIAAGYVVTVDDPLRGPTIQPGPPIHTEPPLAVRGPAPALGQHTDETLAELLAAFGERGEWAPPPGREAPERAATVRWPLQGVRVLDLGMHLAGPLGPMFLGDLGAEVIKVEQPTGDAMRWNEAAFEGCQRGKRAVCIDLRDPAQRPVLEALVDRADVVHHNIRLHSAERLGIDAATLRAGRDRLVWAHVSTYGPTGPRMTWPGFDQIAQAMTGWETASGGEGNPPTWLRFGMMDHLAALGSVVATLLGLIARERTGRGQSVSASLLGAAILSTAPLGAHARGDHAKAPTLDARQTGLGPACRIYEVADGWIALVDCHSGAVERLCAAVGAERPDDLEATFATFATFDALAALREGGIAAEQVRLEQRRAFFADDANRAAGLVASYPHAAYGQVEQIGKFWDFDELGVRLERSAPTLGQHSDEIRAELGLLGSMESTGA